MFFLLHFVKTMINTQVKKEKFNEAACLQEAKHLDILNQLDGWLNFLYFI